MSLYDYDREIAQQSGKIIIGIDEAGRGPLAGDVYAAAVILDPYREIPGINDSKKLTAKQRDMLYEAIITVGIKYAVGIASVAEIEQINILNAAMLAMKRAYEQLGVNEGVTVLIDGNKTPDIPGSTAIVKGDGTSASIAAASIIAKVTRDRYMTEMDALYPEYGFAKHKGYGTAAHCAAIERCGLSPIHRRSFVHTQLKL